MPASIQPTLLAGLSVVGGDGGRIPHQAAAAWEKASERLHLQLEVLSDDRNALAAAVKASLSMIWPFCLV